LLFSLCYADPPHLHSFPTRRSSDLPPRRIVTNRMSRTLGRITGTPSWWRRSQPSPAVVPNRHSVGRHVVGARCLGRKQLTVRTRDRKSTRLNSSHVKISYAVFCLKK